MIRALFSFLKQYLVSGIIILVPLSLTIWIFRLLIVTLDRFSQQFLKLLLPGKIESLFPFEIPGYGILFTLILTLLVGIIGRNYFGQYFIRLSERVLAKVPFATTIYSSVKQVLSTVMERGEGQSAYKGVALIEYPRKGLYAIAFITGKPDRSYEETLDGEKLINLFVPTTPNPTSGFYVVARESEVRSLEIPVEKALRLILSCGMIHGQK